MIKIKANGTEEELKIEDSSNGILINGSTTDYDIIKESDTKYHLIKNNQSYNLEVLEQDAEKKEFLIKANGNEYNIKATDKYDELLSKMGISRGASAKVNEMKAPMPGLVLDIKVEPGQTIAKDEPLLILEAMKMENVIKSPADVVVKSIEVAQQDSVEKNQILIKFEWNT